MQPFIVLSLPRSRTAWLAHYLSYRGQFNVGHDISLECDHIEDFLAAFHPQLCPFAFPGLFGTIETGAVLAWRLLMDRLPKAKFLAVRRPVPEVVASLHKVGVKPDLQQLYARNDMLDQFESQPEVHSIPWDGLSDPDIAGWIFEHLLETEWDPGWFHELSCLNIQINMENRVRRIIERQSAMAALIEECEIANAKAILAPRWAHQLS